MICLLFSAHSPRLGHIFNHLKERIAGCRLLQNSLRVNSASKLENAARPLFQLLFSLQNTRATVWSPFSLKTEAAKTFQERRNWRLFGKSPLPSPSSSRPSFSLAVVNNRKHRSYRLPSSSPSSLSLPKRGTNRFPISVPAFFSSDRDFPAFSSSLLFF